MGEAIGEGVLMGLLLGVLVGPVFFLLIETATNKGLKAAFFMDAGVVLSDVLWVSVLYFGAALFLLPVMESKYTALVAGLIFLAMGTATWLSRARAPQPSGKRAVHGGYFLRGFVLNSVNPSVAVFWFGMVSMATLQFERDGLLIFLFLSSIIVTSVLLDTLKIYIAHRMGALFTDRGKRWLKRIAGSVLMGFGTILIVRYFGA